MTMAAFSICVRLQNARFFKLLPLCSPHAQARFNVHLFYAILLAT